MLDLLARVFGRDNSSAQVAKDRLRLVLVHDRSSVSPQVVEALKEELIAVISRYMEIDTANMDVALTNGGTEVALVANIPVRRVKRAVSGNR